MLFTSAFTGLPCGGTTPTIVSASAWPSHAAVHIAAVSGSQRRPGMRLVVSLPSSVYLIVAAPNAVKVRATVSAVPL